MTTTPFSAFIRTDISEPSFLSSTPVAFHTLCGVPMYDWVRRACIEAGAKTVTILSEGELPKQAEERAIVLPANIPLIITGICLLMVLCSRRVTYPWLISVFSLAIPILLMVTSSIVG